ncbi:MAG: site-specific DNA-methyltransferase [Pseudomonadota bacterium]
MKNAFYFGDNLNILREYIPDESVDLIYLDPPFNSSATYNLLFKSPDRSKWSDAQIATFEDTWLWGEIAEETFLQLETGAGHVGDVMAALRRILGENNMLAYLTMMAARLVELERVLKPSGSIYLHCDTTASHYIKVLLDAVFGHKNYLNEVTWKRTSSHNDPSRYGRISDRILYYSKSKNKTFNKIYGDYSDEQIARYKYEDDQGKFKAENLTAPHFSATRTVEWRGSHPGANRQWRFGFEELELLWQQGRILTKRDGTPRKDGLKEYLGDAKGQLLQDIWTDVVVGPTSGERLGYPTQKPVALLDRIISASSNEGDVVLDPSGNQ